ncbi:hypothetical protein GCM10010524_14020 [Streptomyces mexicanus]
MTPLSVGGEDLVHGAQGGLREDRRVQLLAFLLRTRHGRDLVARLDVPVRARGRDDVLQRQVDLDQQVTGVRLIRDLMSLREAVRVHGGGQHLVHEPLDSFDVSVPVSGTTLFESGVPRLDPGSLFPSAPLVPGAGRLEPFDALLLIARMLLQGSVEALASGLDLRVISTAPNSQHTEQSTRRFRLVLLPSGEWGGLGVAFRWRKGRGSELLSQPLESEWRLVQHSCAEQL